jgi:membrane-bound serine protease (ClpP class)
LRLREATPICSGKGVLAVQTVKAALVAAIAVVVLVVSVLPASAGKNDSLALTVSIDGAIGPAAAS